VITFGAGGTMIELIADRAMELPPLNQFLARRLIERSAWPRRWANGAARRPADMEALEQMLLRVSEMVCELPQLREMDINPIIVDDTGAVAVDARIVIDACAADLDRAGGLQPPGHPALPGALRREWPLKGGGCTPCARSTPTTPTCCRPSCAPVAREPLLPLRQHHARAAAAHAGALHADRLRPRDGAGGRCRWTPRSRARTARSLETERIVGVSRYITNPDQTSCEFSLVVADDFKGQGLGSRLMLSIMDAARAKGLARSTAWCWPTTATCSS
jgi:acetyltransferase